MKIIVIGAGIMGALMSYRLAEAGADVTLLEAGQPASAASGASFGWINANFFLNEDHFRLRFAGINAHRRLLRDLGTRAIGWPGALVWEEKGGRFDAQYNTLKELGYSVRAVNATEFATLEPHVVPPERALLFEEEAVVDLVALTGDALCAATANGAKLISGVRATDLIVGNGEIVGVRTGAGDLQADQVVVSAGVGTQALLQNVDVPVPMLHRPGLILRSEVLPPLLYHVLAAPDQELRQTPEGYLLAPTAANHQADDADRIAETPDVLADRAALRVQKMLDRAFRWERVSMAERPMPEDGLPVIGPCGPQGLYAVTMHSGATLAPLVAELATAEIMGVGLSGERTRLLSPYRPQRFTE
ncbi:FAD-dependent oxidoreductase [uncultured Roseobacter sp.]|uniref:NAD(P)/FAD-dependent oxidoreductase n=1 Tax=uncultured Roseobacter sp. TaxID=114847 RepID=UPI00261F208B|nr:FAD-dependent oxidoreductase [uncultured Roseobacter sp.]